MSRIDLGNNIKDPKTVPATVEGFYERTDSEHTGRICAELADFEESRLRGELDKSEYKSLKDKTKIDAFFYTPHAHFEKGYKSRENEPVDSGKAILDVDGNPNGREVYTQRVMGRERELGINMFNISISGTGFAVLFDIPEGLDRKQAQAWMAHELGDVVYDKGVHDVERAVYIPCREYILYIDEELMFGDELHPAVLKEEELRKYTGKGQKSQSQGQAQCIALPSKMDERVRFIAEGVMKAKELEPSDFLNEGGRHTTVKIFLSGATQLLDKSEINGVLQELMPDHWNDENIQKLVNDFYQNYTNPSQRLLKYQEQLFTQSQRMGMPSDAIDLPAKKSGPSLQVDINKLPIGLKESLKPYPENMWPALLVGQLPAMMALADGVTFRYCDGKISHLGGMAIIIGEQASNKSAIEEAVERWLVDLRHEDELLREREDKVREANKRRKANERALEAPAGVIRVVPITISCSKLLKRLKQSQGHCLYSICTEAETLIKSNGSGAWAQKWDIYRNAFARERWGVDFNSEQSESGDVKVAYCWTLLGTPRTVMKMFSGKNESNAENGLSSRMMLSEMPDSLFEKITVFKELSEEENQRINLASNMLRSASGFYETPRLRKAINQWLEEKRIESSMDVDVIKDRFRRRAGVIGFRCGVVFMLLAGKESKACVDFAVQMADYTLRMQEKVFRPLLAKYYAKDNDSFEHTSTNGSIFERLPSPFNLTDLRRLKGSDFSVGALYTIISRWKNDGWVEKSGKSWIKKR